MIAFFKIKKCIVSRLPVQCRFSFFCTNHLTVAVSRGTPETLAIHENGCVCTAIYCWFYNRESLMPKLILFSAVWVFTIWLVRSKKKTTEEFEINMWRKMCHVLSAKIVYVVRLHHSEHRVTPKMWFCPLLESPQKKEKEIYSKWLVCIMCSVRNLGKCTLNYKRKVFNKLFDWAEKLRVPLELDGLPSRDV